MSYNCATQVDFVLKFCDVDDKGKCAAMNQAVSITPKFSAFLSILGTLLIMYRFFHIPKKDRKTHDRIMFGMSIMNLLGGIAFFNSQWPYAYVEPGHPYSSSYCNWQGWAVQQFSSVFWYNAALSTVFVLKIRYGWTDDQIKKYEPLLHVVSLLFPTITSFVGLGLQMYGTSGPWCFIHIKYNWARWAFFYDALWASMVYSTVCMVSIWKVVKESDDRTKRSRGSTAGQSPLPKLRGHTRVVAVQAALYVVAFLCTWVCGTANRLYGAYTLTTGMPCALFWLMWLNSLCSPLQGFASFLVYIYPRVSEARREARHEAKERAAKNIILTRKEAFIGHCLRAYKVVFGTTPFNDSDAARASGTTTSRSSSALKIPNRVSSPSLTTRPTLLGSTHSDSAPRDPVTSEPVSVSVSASNSASNIDQTTVDIA